MVEYSNDAICHDEKNETLKVVNQHIRMHQDNLPFSFIARYLCKYAALRQKH